MLTEHLVPSVCRCSSFLTSQSYHFHLLLLLHVQSLCLTCVHVSVSVLCACVHVLMCMQTHCMHVCMCARICMSVCSCACVHACVCICYYGWDMKCPLQGSRAEGLVPSATVLRGRTSGKPLCHEILTHCRNESNGRS